MLNTRTQRAWSSGMTTNYLSDGHPLINDPQRPWPYKVLVGYRAPGNRNIVCSRAIYIRASSEDLARMCALREARGMMPMIAGGKRLKASRIVSSRPLDRSDCHNARAEEKVMTMSAAQNQREIDILGNK